MPSDKKFDAALDYYYDYVEKRVSLNQLPPKLKIQLEPFQPREQYDAYTIFWPIFLNFTKKDANLNPYYCLALGRRLPSYSHNLKPQFTKPKGYVAPVRGPIPRWAMRRGSGDERMDLKK